MDAPRLRALKNVHAGKRGFIFCNGPSLNTLDLSRLRNEITIGMNALYLKFDEMGFAPTYYIVEDDLVAEDRRDDINAISGTTRLYSLRLAYCLDRAEDTIFMNHAPDSTPWPNQKAEYNMDMRFSEDASLATFGGNTVTYTALQIAYHVGLREVYIIGADHDYAVPGRYQDRDENENFVIEPDEDDVNHFDPRYFGKGYRWHNPKVHKIENAYRNARIFYEANGGKIFNATPGGKLETFERVNYEDLFQPGYVNHVYETFREEMKSRVILPLEYDGSFMEFDGTACISRKIPECSSDGYTVEVLLYSEAENFERAYTETSPPMPLVVQPVHLFQLSDHELRIRLNKEFDYRFSKFSNNAWYRITVTADRRRPLTTLSINGIPVLKKPVFLPLQKQALIGKGAMQRYWKGRIGHVSVTTPLGSVGDAKLLYIADK